MGRVFVVQESKYNYEDAKRFGELVVLSNDDYPSLKKDQRAITPLLEDFLFYFNPVEDHLLLIGDPILIGLCVALVAKRTSTIPVLKWDRRSASYQPVTIFL